ncbi:unnamed protein product [Amoebophrya sp. A120]|nr:unnamed protein product [Amoebophrya sp. A120]|eukprot:GSA120T00005913001.1
MVRFRLLRVFSSALVPLHHCGRSSWQLHLFFCCSRLAALGTTGGKEQVADVKNIVGKKTSNSEKDHDRGGGGGGSRYGKQKAEMEVDAEGTNHADADPPSVQYFTADEEQDQEQVQDQQEDRSWDEARPARKIVTKQASTAADFFQLKTQNRNTQTEGQLQFLARENEGNKLFLNTRTEEHIASTTATEKKRLLSQQEELHHQAESRNSLSQAQARGSGFWRGGEQNTTSDSLATADGGDQKEKKLSEGEPGSASSAGAGPTRKNELQHLVRQPVPGSLRKEFTVGPFGVEQGLAAFATSWTHHTLKMKAEVVDCEESESGADVDSRNTGGPSTSSAGTSASRDIRLVYVFSEELSSAVVEHCKQAVPEDHRQLASADRGSAAAARQAAGAYNYPHEKILNANPVLGRDHVEPDAQRPPRTLVVRLWFPTKFARGAFFSGEDRTVYRRKFYARRPIPEYIEDISRPEGEALSFATTFLQVIEAVRLQLHDGKDFLLREDSVGASPARPGPRIMRTLVGKRLSAVTAWQIFATSPVHLFDQLLLIDPDFPTCSTRYLLQKVGVKYAESSKLAGSPEARANLRFGLQPRANPENTEAAKADNLAAEDLIAELSDATYTSPAEYLKFRDYLEYLYDDRKDGPVTLTSATNSVQDQFPGERELVLPIINQYISSTREEEQEAKMRHQLYHGAVDLVENDAAAEAWAVRRAARVAYPVTLSEFEHEKEYFNTHNFPVYLGVASLASGTPTKIAMAQKFFFLQEQLDKHCYGAAEDPTCPQVTPEETRNFRRTKLHQRKLDSTRNRLFREQWLDRLQEEYADFISRWCPLTTEEVEDAKNSTLVEDLPLRPRIGGRRAGSQSLRVRSHRQNQLTGNEAADDMKQSPGGPRRDMTTPQNLKASSKCESTFAVAPPPRKIAVLYGNDLPRPADGSITPNMFDWIPFQAALFVDHVNHLNLPNLQVKQDKFVQGEDGTTDSPATVALGFKLLGGL